MTQQYKVTHNDGYDVVRETLVEANRVDIAEGNLIFLNVKEQPIAMYAPLVWRSVNAV